MAAQIFREVDRGNLPGVKRLLETNPACVDVTSNGDDRTPLHLASLHGFDDIVSELLKHGARYEAQDKHGSTALHLACDSGSIDTVRQLLGAGRKMSVRIRNRNGQTPLHIAVLGQSEEMVKELIAAGAKTDVKDKDGFIAMDYVPPDCEGMLQLLAGCPVQRDPRMSPDAVKDPLSNSVDSSRGRRNSPDNQNHRRYDRNPSLSPRIVNGRQNSSPTTPTKSPATPTRNSMKSNSRKPTAQTTTTGQKPAKQIQMQEVQREVKEVKEGVKEVGLRVDALDEAMATQKTRSEKWEETQAMVDSHDRQIAELDERLSIHESHLRGVKPQVQELGEDVRKGKDKYDHLQWVVNTWRESVQGVLDSLTGRMHTLEAGEGGRGLRKEESIKQAEDKSEEIEAVTAKVKAAVDRGAKLEKQVSEVQSRLTRIESTTSEVTTGSGASTAEHHVLDPEVGQRIDTLQEQVDDAQKRADKVEKLYNDQLHDQLIRKREQDKELSERESKILDLRRMALEEENHRRQLVDAQEEQKQRMSKLEKQVEVLLGQMAGMDGTKGVVTSNNSKRINDKVVSRVKELESQVMELKSRVAAAEAAAGKRNACCVIC